MKKLDAIKIKKEFPILKKKVNGKKLVYLDNAATMQKPKQVIKKVQEYYSKINANIHRGVHKLSELATEEYENARRKTADFINADPEEIIFTGGTTESLNLLAYSLGDTLRRGDEIVLTVMEHHSNFVPWQQIARKKGAKLKFIPLAPDGKLDMNSARKLITKKTKIVSVAHISNVLGTLNPVKELSHLAHSSGAVLIVDAAQSAPHIKLDVRKLDCDFLAFSAHKMCGPTGVGVLYGRKKKLAELQPFLYGGGMIREVSLKKSTWADLPMKFEAGTPNIAGAIGFGAAIDYLNFIGMKNIEEYENQLVRYAVSELLKVKDLTVYGPKERISVVSFNINGIHPHDISSLLDREGIAVRGGHHCAMPLMKVLDIYGNVRASFCFYNTKEDVDKLVKALKKAREVFKSNG